MRNTKTIIVIFFFLLTNMLLFCDKEDKFQYWSRDGNQLTPDKDDEDSSKGISFSEDAAFWDQKIKDALQSNVLNCLPPEWGEPLKAFKDSPKSKLEIWIDNEMNDWAQAEDRRTNKSEGVCGTHSGGTLFLRTKQSYEEHCGDKCGEATALHELIHKAVGISDHYHTFQFKKKKGKKNIYEAEIKEKDYPIDPCVYLALKKSGSPNCANLVSAGTCKNFCKDCRGHEGGTSRCCKRN